ncbi:uncharacterized protein LOC133818205 [Humulus lupulus]|uniref:uncharacterized protein LOC133818205 n=1 Tax=Humulus lupulus TaxID=3486 RepID=UPI002B40FC02|nr:uncharacterized protein LOC133818205 [Humulus lupulus]
MATEADTPDVILDTKGQVEDVYLTTGQFEKTVNEGFSVELKKCESQTNEHLETHKVISENKQVSDSTKVEIINNVVGNNFGNLEDGSFLTAPSGPIDCNEEASKPEHCLVDDLNPSEIEILPKAKHLEKGQEFEVSQETIREGEIVEEKNQEPDLDERNHSTETSSHAMEAGEPKFEVEGEEIMKDKINHAHNASVILKQQDSVNEESTEKETEDPEKDEREKMEESQLELFNREVPSILEATLDHSNEVSVHTPDLTVCSDVQSVTKTCLKDVKVDNNSNIEATPLKEEYTEEREFEGIKEEDKCIDLVTEKRGNEVNYSSENIGTEDEKDHLMLDSTGDASISTIALSQESQSNKSGDHLKDKLDRILAADEVGERDAEITEEKFKEVPGIPCQEKNQDNDETSKQEKDENPIEDELQDKSSSVTLFDTKAEDTSPHELSNPEILKDYSEIRSDYIAKESQIEVTKQIEVLEETVRVSSTEQDLDGSSRKEDIHEQCEELDITEAVVEEAQDRERSNLVATNDFNSTIEFVQEEKITELDSRKHEAAAEEAQEAEVSSPVVAKGSSTVKLIQAEELTELDSTRHGEHTDDSLLPQNEPEEKKLQTDLNVISEIKNEGLEGDTTTIASINEEGETKNIEEIFEKKEKGEKSDPTCETKENEISNEEIMNTPSIHSNNKIQSTVAEFPINEAGNSHATCFLVEQTKVQEEKIDEADIESYEKDYKANESSKREEKPDEDNLQHTISEGTVPTKIELETSESTEKPEEDCGLNSKGSLKTEAAGEDIAEEVKKEAEIAHIDPREFTTKSHETEEGSMLDDTKVHDTVRDMADNPIIQAEIPEDKALTSRDEDESQKLESKGNSDKEQIVEDVKFSIPEPIQWETSENNQNTVKDAEELNEEEYPTEIIKEGHTTAFSPENIQETYKEYENENEAEMAKGEVVEEVERTGAGESNPCEAKKDIEIFANASSVKEEGTDLDPIETLIKENKVEGTFSTNLLNDNDSNEVKESERPLELASTSEECQQQAVQRDEPEEKFESWQQETPDENETEPSSENARNITCVEISKELETPGVGESIPRKTNEDVEKFVVASSVKQEDQHEVDKGLDPVDALKEDIKDDDSSSTKAVEEDEDGKIITVDRSTDIASKCKSDQQHALQKDDLREKDAELLLATPEETETEPARDDAEKFVVASSMKQEDQLEVDKELDPVDTLKEETKVDNSLSTTAGEEDEGSKIITTDRSTDIASKGETNQQYAQQKEEPREKLEDLLLATPEEIETELASEDAEKFVVASSVKQEEQHEFNKEQDSTEAFKEKTKVDDSLSTKVVVENEDSKIINTDKITDIASKGDTDQEHALQKDEPREKLAELLLAMPEETETGLASEDAENFVVASLMKQEDQHEVDKELDPMDTLKEETKDDDSLSTKAMEEDDSKIITADRSTDTASKCETNQQHALQKDEPREKHVEMLLATPEETETKLASEDVEKFVVASSDQHEVDKKLDPVDTLKEETKVDDSLSTKAVEEDEDNKIITADKSTNTTSKGDMNQQHALQKDEPREKCEDLLIATPEETETEPKDFEKFIVASSVKQEDQHEVDKELDPVDTLKEETKADDSLCTKAVEEDEDHKIVTTDRSTDIASKGETDQHPLQFDEPREKHENLLLVTPEESETESACEATRNDTYMGREGIIQNHEEIPKTETGQEEAKKTDDTDDTEKEVPETTSAGQETREQALRELDGDENFYSKITETETAENTEESQVITGVETRPPSIEIKEQNLDKQSVAELSSLSLEEEIVKESSKESEKKDAILKLQEQNKVIELVEEIKPESLEYSVKTNEDFDATETPEEETHIEEKSMNEAAVKPDNKEVLSRDITLEEKGLASSVDIEVQLDSTLPEILSEEMFLKEVPDNKEEDRIYNDVPNEEGLDNIETGVILDIANSITCMEVEAIQNLEETSETEKKKDEAKNLNSTNDQDKEISEELETAGGSESVPCQTKEDVEGFAGASLVNIEDQKAIHKELDPVDALKEENKVEDTCSTRVVEVDVENNVTTTERGIEVALTSEVDKQQAMQKDEPGEKLENLLHEMPKESETRLGSEDVTSVACKEGVGVDLKETSKTENREEKESTDNAIDSENEVLETPSGGQKISEQVVRELDNAEDLYPKLIDTKTAEETKESQVITEVETTPPSIEINEQILDEQSTAELSSSSLVEEMVEESSKDINKGEDACLELKEQNEVTDLVEDIKPESLEDSAKPKDFYTSKAAEIAIEEKIAGENSQENSLPRNVDLDVQDDSFSTKTVNEGTSLKEDEPNMEEGVKIFDIAPEEKCLVTTVTSEVQSVSVSAEIESEESCLKEATQEQEEQVNDSNTALEGNSPPNNVDLDVQDDSVSTKIVNEGTSLKEDKPNMEEDVKNFDIAPEEKCLATAITSEVQYVSVLTKIESEDSCLKEATQEHEEQVNGSNTALEENSPPNNVDLGVQDDSVSTKIVNKELILNEVEPHKEEQVESLNIASEDIGLVTSVDVKVQSDSDLARTESKETCLKEVKQGHDEQDDGSKISLEEKDLANNVDIGVQSNSVSAAIMKEETSLEDAKPYNEEQFVSHDIGSKEKGLESSKDIEVQSDFVSAGVESEVTYLTEVKHDHETSMKESEPEDKELVKSIDITSKDKGPVSNVDLDVVSGGIEIDQNFFEKDKAKNQENIKTFDVAHEDEGLGIEETRLKEADQDDKGQVNNFDVAPEEKGVASNVGGDVQKKEDLDLDEIKEKKIPTITGECVEKIEQEVENVTPFEKPLDGLPKDNLQDSSTVPSKETEPMITESNETPKETTADKTERENAKLSITAPTREEGLLQKEDDYTLEPYDTEKEVANEDSQKKMDRELDITPEIISDKISTTSEDVVISKKEVSEVCNLETLQGKEQSVKIFNAEETDNYAESSLNMEGVRTSLDLEANNTKNNELPRNQNLEPGDLGEVLSYTSESVHKDQTEETLTLTRKSETLGENSEDMKEISRGVELTLMVDDYVNETQRTDEIITTEVHEEVDKADKSENTKEQIIDGKSNLKEFHPEPNEDERVFKNLEPGDLGEMLSYASESVHKDQIEETLTLTKKSETIGENSEDTKEISREVEPTMMVDDHLNETQSTDKFITTEVHEGVDKADKSENTKEQNIDEKSNLKEFQPEPNEDEKVFKEKCPDPIITEFLKATDSSENTSGVNSQAEENTTKRVETLVTTPPNEEKINKQINPLNDCIELHEEKIEEEITGEVDNGLDKNDTLTVKKPMEVTNLEEAQLVDESVKAFDNESEERNLELLRSECAIPDKVETMKLEERSFNLESLHSKQKGTETENMVEENLNVNEVEEAELESSIEDINTIKSILDGESVDTDKIREDEMKNDQGPEEGKSEEQLQAPSSTLLPEHQKHETETTIKTNEDVITEADLRSSDSNEKEAPLTTFLPKEEHSVSEPREVAEERLRTDESIEDIKAAPETLPGYNQEITRAVREDEVTSGISTEQVEEALSSALLSEEPEAKATEAVEKTENNTRELEILDNKENDSLATDCGEETYLKEDFEDFKVEEEIVETPGTVLTGDESITNRANPDVISKDQFQILLSEEQVNDTTTPFKDADEENKNALNILDSEDIKDFRAPATGEETCLQEEPRGVEVSNSIVDVMGSDEAEEKNKGASQIVHETNLQSTEAVLDEKVIKCSEEIAEVQLVQQTGGILLLGEQKDGIASTTRAIEEEESTKVVEVIAKNDEETCSKKETRELEVSVSTVEVLDSDKTEEITESTETESKEHSPNTEVVSREISTDQPLPVDKDELFTDQAVPAGTSTEQLQIPSSSTLTPNKENHEAAAIVTNIEEDDEKLKDYGVEKTVEEICLDKEEPKKLQVSEFEPWVHAGDDIQEPKKEGESLNEVPKIEPRETEEDTGNAEPRRAAVEASTLDSGEREIASDFISEETKCHESLNTIENVEIFENHLKVATTDLTNEEYQREIITEAEKDITKVILEKEALTSIELSHEKESLGVEEAQSSHETCKEQSPMEADTAEIAAAKITTSAKDAPKTLPDPVEETSQRAESKDIKSRNETWVGDREIKGEQCGKEKEAVGDSGERKTGTESAVISLSELIQSSTEENTEVVEKLSKEKEPKSSKEVEHDQAHEEDDEEEEEEHEDEDHPDAPILVQASNDIDAKAARKKSQGLFSGVGSKVKHSISKVKKAITGKSSHSTKTQPSSS